MKTKLSTIVMLIALFTVALLATPKTTTITGILTDDMCTKKHMMPGKPNADCVRECIKHGAKYVVVSAGKVYAVKASPEMLGPVAAKKVTVTGVVQGSAIVASAVEAAN